MSPVVVILITQLIFSATDLLARAHLKGQPFSLQSFTQLWFIWYIIVRAGSTFAQFYVFSKVDLGKTVTLFSIAGIIFANLLGVLVLKEVLSFKDYVGLFLAITAFLILSIR